MSSKQRTRRGAAAVEFALIAPIFFFGVIMPMIEFGRAMVVSNSLAAASGIGCRAGVLPGADNAAINTAVTNSLAAANVAGANPLVIKVNGQAANASTAVQGDSISVTVSVAYNAASWLPINLNQFLGNRTLSCTQIMRRE